MESLGARLRAGALVEPTGRSRDRADLPNVTPLPPAIRTNLVHPWRLSSDLFPLPLLLLGGNGRADGHVHRPCDAAHRKFRIGAHIAPLHKCVEIELARGSFHPSLAPFSLSFRVPSIPPRNT
jgi:hypothetical protein